MNLLRILIILWITYEVGLFFITSLLTRTGIFAVSATPTNFAEKIYTWSKKSRLRELLITILDPVGMHLMKEWEKAQ